MDNSHSPKVPHRAGPVGGAANVHDPLKGHESTSELRENVNAGLEPDAPKSPTLKSLAGTQPVLVRAYPTAAAGSTYMRRSRHQLRQEPLQSLPPLSSFSFQDILKEIDPEIQPSIDAIPEIFGRSKLSLADEYSSHLPPQEELPFSTSASPNEVLEAIPNARLEPVEEGRPGNARRQSLALVGTRAAAQSKSGAVAATSTASVEHTVGSASQEADSEAETKASLLPYVLS